MSMRWLLTAGLLIGSAYSQVEEGGVIPKITTASFRSGATITLRLSLGYVSAVHVSEPVSSIAIGDPAAFRAEHSEADPELIFFKPLTAERVRSNAIIVTRSGTTLTLALVSYGHAGAGTEVDFMLDCRPVGRALIARSFIVTGLEAGGPNQMNGKQAETDVLDEEIRRQAELPVRVEGAGRLTVAVGRSRQIGKETIVSYSALNGSDAPVELLPPQMDLSVEQPGRKKHLTSDPVPLLRYRMSRRRLEPGERSDGVVVFVRPASKTSAAELQLRLAQADRADRPIVLAVPFLPALSEQNHE